MKKKLNKRSFSLKKMLKSNRMYQFLSLIAAIALWFALASSDSSANATVANIPVDTTALSNSLESMGMDIVSGGNVTVSVRVEGKREVVGNLTSSDILVTPAAINIDEPGTYSIGLVATKKDSLDDYQIISVLPERIEVVVKKVTSKKVSVEVDTSNVLAEGDLILGQATCSVSEVNLVGSEELLERIDRAVAMVPTKTIVSESTTLKAKMVYFDEAGVEVDVSEGLLTGAEDITITVPVLKTSTVSLRVGYSNVPTGLNTDHISATLSTTSIKVAGPADAIDKVETITVGYIDLSKVEVGKEFTFDIELPSGFVNLDSAQSVTVFFSSDDFAQKGITITNPQILTASGYTGSLTAESLTITVMGLKNDINSLTADDLSVTIDCTEIKNEGDVTAQVVVTAPGGEVVWACNRPTAAVHIQVS